MLDGKDNRESILSAASRIGCYAEVIWYETIADQRWAAATTATFIVFQTPEEGHRAIPSIWRVHLKLCLNFPKEPRRYINSTEAALIPHTWTCCFARGRNMSQQSRLCHYAYCE